jgi:hypothetical protein
LTTLVEVVVLDVVLLDSIFRAFSLNPEVSVSYGIGAAIEVDVEVDASNLTSGIVVDDDELVTATTEVDGREVVIVVFG